MSHTEETFVQKRDRRLDEHLAAIRSDPAFKLSEGDTGGFYSVKADAPRKRILIHFTPYTASGMVTKEIYYPATEEKNVESHVKHIEAYFRALHTFSNTKEPLAPENVKLIVRDKVAKLLAENAEKFTAPDAATLTDAGLDANVRGIFTLTLNLPSKQSSNKINIGAVLHVRPISDYLEYKTRYLSLPHPLSFSLQTRDEEHADLLIHSIKDALKEAGFHEHSFPAQTKKSLKIPPYWLNPDNIKIIRTKHFSVYSLRLAATSHHGVKISLHTADRAQAERMKQAIIDEFLPQFQEGGSHAGSPFSIDDVQDFLKERFPPAAARPRQSLTKDIRTIRVDDAIKLLIRTPNIVSNTGEDEETQMICRLFFTPPKKPGETNGLPSIIHSDLNTSNRDLALQRIRTLMNLSELALRAYFSENPDITIPTEYRKKDGKDTLAFSFKKPGDTRVTFEDIAENVIKPALRDFKRYIGWNTDIQKTGSGKWQVKFQVVRNDAEAMMQSTSIFSGPFTVEVNTEEKARQFASDLSMEITKEQYLFSKARPVEHFGERSQNVAIRESLNNILQKYQGDIDLKGNHLLTQLLRDKTPPR